MWTFPRLFCREYSSSWNVPCWQALVTTRAYSRWARGGCAWRTMEDVCTRMAYIHQLRPTSLCFCFTTWTPTQPPRGTDLLRGVASRRSRFAHKGWSKLYIGWRADVRLRRVSAAARARAFQCLGVQYVIEPGSRGQTFSPRIRFQCLGIQSS